MHLKNIVLCGQVVSVLALYSDNPSSNSTEVFNFYYVKFN